MAGNVVAQQNHPGLPHDDETAKASRYFDVRGCPESACIYQLYNHDNRRKTLYTVNIYLFNSQHVTCLMQKRTTDNARGATNTILSVICCLDEQKYRHKDHLNGY